MLLLRLCTMVLHYPRNPPFDSQMEKVKEFEAHNDYIRYLEVPTLSTRLIALPEVARPCLQQGPGTLRQLAFRYR